jgi:hypothetical protein
LDPPIRACSQDARHVGRRSVDRLGAGSAEVVAGAGSGEVDVDVGSDGVAVTVTVLTGWADWAGWFARPQAARNASAATTPASRKTDKGFIACSLSN